MGSLLSSKEIYAPIYYMLYFDTHMTAVYLFAQEFRSRLFTIFFKSAFLMNSRMANRVGGIPPTSRNGHYYLRLQIIFRHLSRAWSPLKMLRQVFDVNKKRPREYVEKAFFHKSVFRS